jgi:hypothetical protein
MRRERLQCLGALDALENVRTTTLPEEVEQALERRCTEITDLNVLQRLVRHLNAPLLLEQLRQGQLVLFTLETEVYFITVGQRVSDQSVVCYTKIAKQTLSPL